ncbi:MAG TPA: caspase family protein [Reyranella sp.]|nr:caspase family protein [Reyranella sp.]
MTFGGRRSFLVGAGGLIAAPAIVRAQARASGAALVIGNSKYRWESSLPNARRDVVDVAKKFQALGLKAELLQDVSLDGMRKAIEKFAANARGADLAAFYFAGHGASWNNDTYLVPADADLADPATVPNLVSVTSVGAAVKEARHRLLLFDNCRNNPADGWRQRAALGQASVNTTTQKIAATFNGLDTLVLYSTAPGHLALDGPAGENSPFAAAFLRQLGNPSVDLKGLSTTLRRELLVATEGRQVLWDQNSYVQPFSFPGVRDSSSAAPRGDASRILELPKAYEFARQKGLILPPGLIAWRQPDGSPLNSMIGSFAFDIRLQVSASGGEMIAPGIIVVMAASNGAAEAVMSVKGAAGDLLQPWNLVSTSFSGNVLDYSCGSNDRYRCQLKWRDANSGTFAVLPGSNAGGRVHNSALTRFD